MNDYLINNRFFGDTDPMDLIQDYGSPLYVYNESILRERCREIRSLMSYPNFEVHYSVKANNNIELLKIIKDEGICSDAMSPGELFIAQKAGFKKNEILYVCNNISTEEMANAVDNGLTVSLDSVSQIESMGKTRPGSRIAVRFNPGIGAGHHEKVMTAGEKTKFGVNIDQIDEMRSLIRQYDLKLEGINMHIGSLFLEPELVNSVACNAVPLAVH